ncbi:MAG: hypothetical protein IJP81_05635 [Bacteroidales bacterium]|nr:hypothetical protein [Bacteroidales bacterium]MBQ7278671.1 hypothetical protein [Clostridia bacterium]
MTNVLCWPVEEACERLKSEGVCVELIETRPKRETVAQVRRVVRQQEQDGVCRLVWAKFSV